MKKIVLAATFYFFCGSPLLRSNCAIAQLTYTPVTSGLSSVIFQSGYSELEVGDVDGDGDLDLVSIGDHGSPSINAATEHGIMVWKNNGSGTNWSVVQTGNFGYGGLALGDVNNDGKMDIGYGMHHNYSTTDFGDQYLEVALGDGSGSSWTPYDDGLATQGQSWGMFGVDFGDVNNDGLLDVASNAFSQDGIWVYKNNGNGTWASTFGNLGGNSDEQCYLGDFNNDGNIDMVTANSVGTAWKNNGLGSFSLMQTGIAAGSFLKFDIADVNNDGAKDVAIAYGGSGGGNVLVYTYNKTSLAWQSISTGLPTTGVLGVGLADMDMDGKCDLVSWSATAITIYQGDGAGNWTANGTIPITINSTWGLRCMALGDFDHDGYTDIAYLGDNGSNALYLFLHTVSNPTLNILPENPKGYECFVQGSIQFINWLSSVPAGPLATVMIEFSSNGTSGPWTTVVTSAPNSGVYQWTVPNVNSPNCHLKFTITQGTSVQSVTTSNPFGIGSCATPPPTGVQEVNNIAGNLVTFPNPMSIMGHVQFTLNEPGFTEIKLFDLVGKEVSLILSEHLNTGDHKIQFSSVTFNAGVYFLEVKSARLNGSSGRGEVMMKTKVVVVHNK